MESLSPNGREPYLSMKRQVEIIVLISLMENEGKKKSHLTEFAFLPSAFMKTFTSSNGACTYIFNLTQKWAESRLEAWGNSILSL